MPSLINAERTIGARRLPGSIVLVALLASACTAGGAPDPAIGLPRDRAARPRPVQEVAESVPASVRDPDGNDGRPGNGGPGGGSSPGPGTSAEPEPGPYVAVLDLDDARGDNGLRAPDRADVVHVRISSNGPNARMTVTVGDALPARLAEGEVMGIGIDLYRSASARESAYQLFAEGSDDGWFAWRTTPKGLGDYVGSFEVGGTSVIFEVPWSALGDLPEAEVRVFVDWSAPGPAVLNDSGSDKAPDRGRARFTR